MAPLITVPRDVPGRRPSGRERPWVSLGRDVPPCQRPNRGQDRRRPHRTRLGRAGGTAMSAPPVFVGIEVSKAQLDVAVRPTDAGWHGRNAASGSSRVVERRRAVHPTLVVLEATGGLAGPVTGALAEASLPVVVVNPRPARAVANATGRLATTARREARGRAHVAAAVRPTPRPLPAAPAHAWSALRTRRRPLVQRLTAARRRLQTAPQPIRADIPAHLTWLTRRLARPADDVAAAIHARPLGRATDERRQSTPGVGPIRSRTLVAAVPELGVLNRQESAALMGGAPLNRDRGPVRGKRAVWGGRAQGRAGWSMSTWAAVRHHPVRNTFDERLRAVGKAPKVALTAWMRKLLTMLNAMLKHQTPWHETSAHPS
jgi:transposase